MTEKKDNSDIIGIVIYGRGGQGAVTASQIIAEAAFLSGNFADVHAFPSFGAERRGAPVQVYAKLSKVQKIWDRSQIEHPDIIIVFDETFLTQNIVSSLKPKGFFIINSEKEPAALKNQYNLNEDTKIVVANISKMVLENNLVFEGIPVVNIPILGLLSKALPELNLENLKKVVIKRLGENLAKLNIELIEQGFKLAKTL
ncbi:MAG: 2-oxoacid:acceptor oxidoreductase family protein [Promethearchaeota archaeon]